MNFYSFQALIGSSVGLQPFCLNKYDDDDDDDDDDDNYDDDDARKYR